MHGKTVVITGGTSGIGEAAAVALAAKGAQVVLIARSEARGAASLARIRGAGPGAEHDLVIGDLSTVAAMKAAALAVAGKTRRIDVLINNAGAIFARRELTADGFEMTFAVNHLAYFVVTALLLPVLAQAEGARIVSTASGAHQFGRPDLADLQSEHGYSAFSAYGKSKLCNILWTRELARRLEGTGTTANCLHPGGVATRFGSEAGGFMRTLFGLARPLLLTPQQGADTIVYLASSPDVAGQSGGYYAKRKRIEPSAAARDPGAARRLWEESARLVGLPE